MTVEKTSPDVTRKPKGILGWSIAATVLGFWPVGIIAIVKAAKSQRLWLNKEYEQADSAAKTADILSVVSVGSAFVLFALSSLFMGVSNGTSVTIIGLLILVLSGLIGMLEGEHRTCGLAGGFILGMFPIVGWIMVSTFSWKGQLPDAWLREKPRYAR